MKPPRGPTLVGIAVGLAAALLVLGYASMRRVEAGAAMLPDEGGRVRAVVMQYARGSEFVAPVFKQYLQYQPADVTVYLTCPGEEDFTEICGLVGKVSCQMVPVYTGHVMTAWSRDRWVAMRSPDAAGAIMVLSPKGEMGQDVWPARAGDSHMGEDLARALPAVFSAQRSGLFFDGGDFLADGAVVFVTRAVLERNIQHTVTTRDMLLQALAHDLRLRPILMDEGPLHHAGMFMMAAGTDPQDASGRVMVVADPSLGKPLYAGSPETDAAFTEGPDFSDATQTKYDAVAELCRQNGYRVVRIPVVPAKAGKMYMTYVNVILDRVAGTALTPAHRVVYMSSYAGQEKLNHAAAEVWTALGFEVRPIDCTTVWQSGGTLHCLVNVCQREQ